MEAIYLTDKQTQVIIATLAEKVKELESANMFLQMRLDVYEREKEQSNGEV